MSKELKEAIEFLNKRREDLTYPKNLNKRYDWANQQELNTINRIQNILEGKGNSIIYGSI